MISGPSGQIARLKVAIDDALSAANAVGAGGCLASGSSAYKSARATVVRINFGVSADVTAVQGAGDADEATDAFDADGVAVCRHRANVATRAAVERVV